MLSINPPIYLCSFEQDLVRYVGQQVSLALIAIMAGAVYQTTQELCIR